MISGLLKTMRPRQWSKNGFVFAALFFDRKVLTPDSIIQAVLAFTLLCLISSAVYIMNDLADIESDRQHPIKRNRPLPSGKLNATTAKIALVVLVVAGLGASLCPLTRFWPRSTGLLLAPSRPIIGGSNIWSCWM